MSICELCKHSQENLPPGVPDSAECEQCTANVNCVYLRFELDRAAVRRAAGGVIG